MIPYDLDSHTQPAPTPPGTMEGIFDRYVQPIYRFLYSRLGNREDAEDLTSETFLKAAKELDVNRSEASIASWLFTVARTVLADHWRRYYRHGSPLPFEDIFAESDATNLDAVKPANATEQRVAQILAALPERSRRVLELRFLAGLTVREAAREMGVTPGNLKVMQHRALSRALAQSLGFESAVFAGNSSGIAPETVEG